MTNWTAIVRLSAPFRGTSHMHCCVCSFPKVAKKGEGFLEIAARSRGGSDLDSTGTYAET